MIVRQIPVTEEITTNAYFYIDEQTKHGFLIDPGAEADTLLKIIADNGWIIEKILLTHGHFDHIGAVEQIHSALNIPYFIHQNGKEYLTNGIYNLSPMFGKNIELHEAQYLNHNDIVALDACHQTQLQVIHTPGHTTDSVLYYDEKNQLAFCGDTIFKDSYGRTDLPGGNIQQLMRSIKERVLTLPGNTLLYSGHSEPTTINKEKNLYL